MVITRDTEMVIAIASVVAMVQIVATVAVVFKRAMKTVMVVETTAKEGESIDFQKQHDESSRTNFVAYTALRK
jgi:hypothetical protein